MALERRDPVPAGRYSVFILPAEEARWIAWIAANRATVKPVLSVPKQRVGSSAAPFATTWMGDIIQDYAGSAVLFDVTAPTPWVGLGLPTIETRTKEAWLLEERENLSCFWIWTESGPSISCTPEGPARIDLFTTLAPWVLAGLLGWAFIARKPARAALAVSK